MNSNKYTSTKTKTSNLIGESTHRHYLQLQSSYVLAQRGGVKFPFENEAHCKRLISNVNILTSSENKHLIFSESIFSN